MVRSVSVSQSENRVAGVIRDERTSDIVRASSIISQQRMHHRVADAQTHARPSHRPEPTSRNHVLNACVVLACLTVSATKRRQ